MLNHLRNDTYLYKLKLLKYIKSYQVILSNLMQLNVSIMEEEHFDEQLIVLNLEQ
jgi:hypothetical protein